MIKNCVFVRWLLLTSGFIWSLDYRKHKNPALTDEVSRLRNIRKRGRTEKGLHANKIFMVEDFLIRLLIDPEGLQRVTISTAKMQK